MIFRSPHDSTFLKSLESTKQGALPDSAEGTEQLPEALAVFPSYSLHWRVRTQTTKFQPLSGETEYTDI